MKASKKIKESVWDYPRPPRIEKTEKRIEIYFNNIKIADSMDTIRFLETSHPPTYYIPRKNIKTEFLIPSDKISMCEWKGKSKYLSLSVNGRISENAAWYYPNPFEKYSEIKDHIAFYAHKVDRCMVNGEEVTPQPGNFYGGWITSDLEGPFKGGPGTWGW